MPPESSWINSGTFMVHEYCNLGRKCAAVAMASETIERNAKTWICITHEIKMKHNLFDVLLTEETWNQRAPRHTDVTPHHMCRNRNGFKTLRNFEKHNESAWKHGDPKEELVACMSVREQTWHQKGSCLFKTPPDLQNCAPWICEGTAQHNSSSTW